MTAQLKPSQLAWCRENFRIRLRETVFAEMQDRIPPKPVKSFQPAPDDGG